VSRRRAVRMVLSLGALAVLLTGALGAQNLLDNPSFDAGTSAWVLGEGTALEWTDALEPSDCSNSGSARIPSELFEGHSSAILQCAALDGEEWLYASVWHRGTGQFDLRLLFYTASDCLSGPISAPVVTEPQEPDVWNLLTMLEPVPVNANGVFLLLAATDVVPHVLFVDDVMLTEEFPIFLDGFDGNDAGESSPCRW
jgi:hypothetical protein